MFGRSHLLLVAAIVIAGLAPGQKTPSDEQIIAQATPRGIDQQVDSLMARLDKGDSADFQKVAAIGDPIFIRLLPIAKRRVRAFDAPKSSEEAETRARNVIAWLSLSAGPKRTTEMTALFHLARDDRIRGRLMDWMANVGEFAPNRKLFERELLKAADAPEWADLPGVYAVDALVRAKNARAVRMLAEVLRDENKSAPVRRAIYIALARTGSPIALDAVRKALHRSRTLPPLAKRAPLPNLKGEDEYGIGSVRATWVDAKGVKWGLIQWDALGNSEDLWLFRLKGNHWTNPVFTGVSEYWPMHQTGTPGEGYEAHDKEMKALIEGGGWKRLVGNPALTKDPAGSGYTDIVKRWLGLNIGDKDEDKDGIPDGIDKNPLTPPRELDETELALKAAFDAQIACRDKLAKNVFVEFPSGIKPFELDSYPGLVLPGWDTLKPTRPGALFGLTIWLGFKSGPPVQFGEDHRTAEVQVEESGGYYDMTAVVKLRKFGSEWFPVGYETKQYGIA